MGEGLSSLKLWISPLPSIRRSTPTASTMSGSRYCGAISRLLRPELLNSGEWLDMKFVTDGELKKPKIDVRFAKRLICGRRRHRLGRIAEGLAFLAFIGVQVYFFIFVAPKVAPNLTDLGPWQGWVFFGITIILMILMAAVRHWPSQLGWRPIERGTADKDDDFDDEDETE